MKKNLLVLMLAASMLASSPVFAQTELNNSAEGETTIGTAVQEDIMPISNESNIVYTMPSYIKNTVMVTDIAENKIATTLNKDDAENPENTINYNITENTLVFDGQGNKKSVSEIKKDDSLTVFTNGYTPAVLMLPPQYEASVVIINGEENKNIDVDTYLNDGEELVNAANTLSVSTDEKTVVVDTQDKAVENASLENKDLVVFYSVSTRSIPAKTTAEKIVVIGENKLALKSIEGAASAATPAPEATVVPETTESQEEEKLIDFSGLNSIVVDGDMVIGGVYVKDGVPMIPLRAVCEAFGMSVSWDGDMRAVMINDGMYSLQIDKNSYAAGKMTPAELEFAPEINNDLTYVPFSFFSDIMQHEWNVNINENGTTVESMELTTQNIAE